MQRLSGHCRAWTLAFDNERRFQQWQAAYGEAAAAGLPQGAQADALREEAAQLLRGLLDVLSGGVIEAALLQQQALLLMVELCTPYSCCLLPSAPKLTVRQRMHTCIIGLAGTVPLRALRRSDAHSLT